jgi:DNA polymerase III delta prime subunit
MTELRQALEEARRALLDLSTRNRLLSLPKPGRSRGVVILDDEDADFVAAALAAGRAFGFEAAGEETPADPEAKPKRRRTSKAAAKAEGVARADDKTTREDWQRDELLRVRLPATDLARRLRDLMTDARTAREETGVPTLYLALGVLSWRDPATPTTERRAPLALLPVTIEREGVSQTFRLRAGATEIAENLSLREMLKVSFGTTLPDFNEADYNPTAWAQAVAGAVKDRADWTVDADALALGLFSFAKFLMWRDLGPEENPGLADHPLVQALVGGAALSTQPTFPDDADVDEAIPVERLDHVVDMDGSQALAAESVRRGGHVVIQGPPGTGKSQTIATILAQAVIDGRTVLFVAEKLAALEVVKRRLENIGLGAACLELHSEKQSKRAVLDELRATLALPPPPRPNRDAVVDRLATLRGRLNRHAAAMRAQAGASGIPLHQVIGTLVGLRRRGAPVPDFTLDVAAWDGATIAAKRDAVRDLAARAVEADGANNPWRGVTVDLGPADADRLMARLPGWIRAFAAAGAAGGEGAGPAGIATRLKSAGALREAPAHDKDAMRSAAWRADPAPLVSLTEAVAQLAIAKRDPRLKPGALDVPGLEEARAGLASSGGFFGFLNASKRAAQEVAARVVRDGAADPLAAIVAAIDGQAARARVRNGGALGAAAFGRLWRGEDTDPSMMSALILWRQKHGAEAAAALAADAPAGDPAMLEAGAAAWSELQQATALDAVAAFGTAEPTFAAITDRLGAWAERPEALAPWQGWRRALAGAQGLDPVVQRLRDGRLSPEAAEDAFAYALHEGLLRAASAQHPDLAAFDAGAYDRLVTEFREADRARVALTRTEAARAHADRVKAVRDGAPGMTVIRGEMEKKRGHLPVRELLLRASGAVQQAKPIFMMSPLSVAQFLAPPHGLRPGLSFDLLVIDEASQVEPVDALGAIARCRQVVVVGDDRQMPPTRFFQRMTEEDGDTPPEDAPDAVAARDVESILGLCNARGVPRAMLRWHYRSRHESLIATSNQEFYENRLLVLPSPRPRSAALGLSLVRVDGAWETGEGTNRAEAAAVAEAVMRHAKETPGDTLGVAAFSIKQRDAIMDAVEAARRADPSADAFFADHADEPFFVKNLENVQGDERDAMLISVGYGRDKDGRLAMRFGPLSAEGGERRLNVLITRAKKRCIVFSGITADDIDLERASGRGVAALKTFLAFAAGPAAAPRAGGEATGGALADAISQAVREAGREPVERVGLAGLFLDVAARGEQGYDLGIEADAGDWAALRCARDRERGRPGALEMMGWKLSRAWSLAWYAQPAAEAAKVITALGATPAPAAPAAAPAAPPPEPGIAEPYREAAPALPPGALEALPTATLAAAVGEIVAVEAPINADSLAERLRLLAGREALTTKDKDAIRQALAIAKAQHGVIDSAGVFTTATTKIVPRDRRAAAAHLRRAAAVPPAEIAATAQALLAARPAMTEAQLADAVLATLGLDAGALVAVSARLAALVGAGTVRIGA